MADWIMATIDMIHSGVPNDMMKKDFEIKVGTMVVKYANYYLQQTTDEGKIERLNHIKEKGLAIVRENMR